ncbi:MAG: putative metal-binding motif-containing protein [Myxococcota bacterium]
MSRPVLAATLPLVLLFACGDPDSTPTSVPSLPLDADEDGFDITEDCDDRDAAVYPGADEICDGIDNDCDDVVDGDGAIDRQTFYTDSDGDGFGDPQAPVQACAASAGIVSDDTDCDDTSAAAYPGGTEVCDGVDNDCDSNVDFDGWVPGDFATLEAVAALTTASHICVASGTYPAAGIQPLAPLTLEGAGVDATVLQGANDIFFETVEALTLRSLTVDDVDHDGTNWTGDGSFVYAEGPVTLENVRFDAPTITYDHGTLVYASGADVTWRDVEIDSAVVDLTSTWYGFAYVDDGLLTLDDVHIHDGTFSGTSSSYGTFYQEYARTNMSGVVVEDNTYDFSSLYGLVWCSEESDETGRGPGGGDTASTFANIAVRNNTLTLSSSFYGAFSLDDYEGFFSMENVAIVGNTVTTGNGTYGWLGYADYGSGFGNTIDNLVIAGNHMDIGSGNAPIIEYFYDITGSQWDIVGNTSTSVSPGVQLDGEDWTLRNVNLVSNDSDPAVTLVYVDGLADLDYVNVFDSDSPIAFEDDDGPVTPATRLAVDPEYVNVIGDPSTWDLTLGVGSPLIDAGDPGVLDADGSRSDIGAYGGPLGDRWSN